MYYLQQYKTKLKYKFINIYTCVHIFVSVENVMAKQGLFMVSWSTAWFTIKDIYNISRTHMIPDIDSKLKAPI